MITLEIDTRSGRRRIDLSACLDAAAEERAHDREYAWIKAVRAARVGHEPLRSALTFRGDSLWWFAELYLHKSGVILDLHRLIPALGAIIASEHPTRIATADRRYGPIVAIVARAHNIAFEGADSWPSAAVALARMDARATALAAAARASRFRTPPVPPARETTIAAFVHSAFWRNPTPEGSDEQYIGPVLQEIERRVARNTIHYIGVGPSTNFRARRWWSPFATRGPGGLTPVEAFAPAERLRGSREIWKARHQIRERLVASEDIRQQAVIDGVDCWPLVREQLNGVALLQLTWSTRAMDEAAAALDTLQPAAAVTYAEAGGWGRALALECRRRGIPLAGLQHGFIYRHWLNYRHETDEMQPDPRNGADRGFPLPDATLVFDEFAFDHLRQAGRFPAAALQLTGSPRFDALRDGIARLSPAALAAVRHEAGARDDQALVLVATKQKEAAHVLPEFIAAVAALPAVHVVIKTHPAETPDVYAGVVAGQPNVSVLPASAPLAPLLGAARAVVTVNSTVAIDAWRLGIPSLVLGLPNNLSPFVDRGAMLGAAGGQEIRFALERVLYDEGFRRTIQAVDGPAAGDGTAMLPAAARAAEAVLRLAQRTHP